MGVTVKFRFLTGRYHATPWDSHVNEGEVEWPPSPWRLLRALMATRYRKVDDRQYPETLLNSLVGKLAAVYPVYRLPAATQFHTRHYMPTGRLTGGGEKTALLFDTFVRVARNEPLVVHWPGVGLSDDESSLLDVVLERMGHLGRAESWVEASRADETEQTFNCFPAEQTAGDQPGTPGERDWMRMADREPLERIRLAAPRGADEYARWRRRVMAEYGLDKAKLSQRERRLLATLPESLVDTLRLETSHVRQQRWSRMPGMKYVTYWRPAGSLSFRPAVVARPRVRHSSQEVTSVRLVLAGKPLPRLEDAVRIGDALRNAAVGRARELAEDGRAPWTLTGRDIPEGLTHAHAYYLPEDADGDGRIDHVFIYAAAGLDRQALRALADIGQLRFIHRPRDPGWRVVLEGFGHRPEDTGTTYADAACVWQSVTPYLRPWHVKKNFGLREQLERECALMGLPELSDVQVLDAVDVHGRRLRPVHFHRFRAKAGLHQPDTRGALLRVTFARPVSGPLALGFAGHFGLGLFRPVQ